MAAPDPAAVVPDLSGSPVGIESGRAVIKRRVGILDPEQTLAQGTMNDSSAPMSVVAGRAGAARKQTLSHGGSCAYPAGRASPPPLPLAANRRRSRS